MRACRACARRSSRFRQSGAVAVMTAISMVALVGFLGATVDLGRMFVIKAELQNAADACALAAAGELDGTANALTRAENAAITAGTLNRANFQSAAAQITAADIKFAVALSSGSGLGANDANYQTQAGGAPANSRYVLCSVPLAGVAMSLTSIVGFGPQSIASQAVATLAPAQSSCAIPLGMCAVNPAGAPGYGLVPGDWYNGRFNAGGGLTGSFNWIDFTPPSGGANELVDLLTGSGQCNISTNTPVGQSGVLGNAAAKAWNSRFGVYQNGEGNPQLATAPPDYTGFAYTTTPEGIAAWPAQRNALPDFLNPRRAPNNDPFQGNAATGLTLSNAYNASTAAEHAANGVATRRLATAPIVDCGGWASSQTVPILSYACILMLHPIASPGDIVNMEYVGLAGNPNSPCATSGLAGGSVGPLVPVLVQ